MKTKTFLNKICSKGFTLIELLVVIAVLGVLAAAVVAAINPVAKINQAKDADVKSDISQISQAMQAYFTTNAAAGNPYYPTSVAAIAGATNELKTEPKDPSGVSYAVAIAPAGCTTLCQNIAVYRVSYADATKYICWDSVTGVLKPASTGVPVVNVNSVTCP